MPGLAGLAVVGSQFLKFYLKDAQEGVYKRRTLATTSTSDSPGPTPGPGIILFNAPPNPPIPTSTRSSTFDPIRNSPTDSTSDDLGTGFVSPYGPGITVRVVVKRGSTKTLWEQYGMQLDEDATYAIIDGLQIQPQRLDILILSDGNRYVVEEQNSPITVLDRVIGWVTQLERRDPSDPIYRA